MSNPEPDEMCGSRRIVRSAHLEDIEIRKDGDGDTGRLVIARAITYDQPEVVSDDGLTFYSETWKPGVFKRSLNARGDRIPLMRVHQRDDFPIGVVRQFVDTNESLTLVAKVSRTNAGDEALELVRDGAIGGVSVGAEQVSGGFRKVPGGIERTECKLSEVSLTALPALSDSKILALRSKPDPDPEPEPEPERERIVVLTPHLDEVQEFLDSLD